MDLFKEQLRPGMQGRLEAPRHQILIPLVTQFRNFCLQSRPFPPVTTQNVQSLLTRTHAGTNTHHLETFEKQPPPTLVLMFHVVTRAHTHTHTRALSLPHTHTHTHTETHTHTGTYTHTDTHTHTHTHKHYTCTHTFAHTHTRATCTHTHTETQAHTHKHITHVCTHTHTHFCNKKQISQ